MTLPHVFQPPFWASRPSAPAFVLRRLIGLIRQYSFSLEGKADGAACYILPGKLLCADCAIIWFASHSYFRALRAQQAEEINRLLAAGTDGTRGTAA